jgi:HSP20 family molecular chaperone IbpA
MNAEPNQDTQTPEKRESEAPQGTERTRHRKVYVPLVDIVETDNVLTLLADMPGVDDTGVEVLIEKNVLTIRGTVADDLPRGYSHSYEEYGVGDYERSFTLPNEIDREAIAAKIKDGVLTLMMPKVKQALAKKITVVAG